MQSMPNIVRDRLKAAQPVANHPDANLLTAFAEQSLPAPERAAVLEHISRCGDCREVVALALPATEVVAPAPSTRPARTAWLTWPVLRWGFVAAGVVTIASLGILQVQRRSTPQMMAFKSPGVAVPESRAQASAPPASAALQAGKDDKTAPTPAAADSVSSTNAPVRAPRPMASVLSPPASVREHAFDVLSGTGGNQARGGPKMPAQWQQNNNNNAQQQVSNDGVPVPTLNQPAGQAFSALKIPSASQNVAVSGAAPTADTEAAIDTGARDQTDSQLQAYAMAPDMIKKAKPPVAAAGQIGGYVVDPSGAVVPNARITITPTSTGGIATAVTNAQGAWLIPGLPAGNYKAQAEAPGFKTSVLAFNYDANRPAIHNFTLSPGSVSETVEVSAENAQVQADTASAGNMITNSQVSEVPLNGRNFTQIAELAPGVVPTPRWTINSAGNLQRSLDQGKTWNMVNVNAAPAGASSLAVVAKASRVKQKDADARGLKKEIASPVFRAVTSTGSEVWAGGSGGALYHSLDAGNTWARVVPSSAGSILTGDVVRLNFSDPQHGTITTSTPEVWTTSDAGQTWQKQ